jgi:hypothetical protein
MSWFAAHPIMAVRLKSGRQKRVPIGRNLVLLSDTEMHCAMPTPDAQRILGSHDVNVDAQES